MRRPLVASLLALAAAACTPATSSKPAASAAAGAALPASAVRHVVVFKYKPGTTPEQIRRVTEAFGALREQIPGIVAFEHGENHSPEGLNQGFTHVYLLTFASPAARDAYLPHPAHKAFGQVAGANGLASAFVVDYSPRE